MKTYNIKVIDKKTKNMLSEAIFGTTEDIEKIKKGFLLRQLYDKLDNENRVGLFIEPEKSLEFANKHFVLEVKELSEKESDEMIKQRQESEEKAKNALKDLIDIIL